MKKITCTLLMLALLLTTVAALAAPPEPGSLTVTRTSIRGNTSWTRESFPEIWITPIFAEYIIQGKEQYPPKFLCITPPDNAYPFGFRSDSAWFIDHDTLLQYDYFAYDRYSFEVFLEKADPSYTIADGSDGVAMYVNPENLRAYGLIDIKEFFGGTSRLEVRLSSYDRTATADQMAALIEAEVNRVRADMRYETLEQYWSKGVFATVALNARRDPVKVQVDASDLIIVSLEESTMTGYIPVADGYAPVNIDVDTYTYVTSKEDESSEMTLADGSTWIVYNAGYTFYASQVLLEEAKSGTLYVTVKLDSKPEEVPTALLEQVNALLTVVME
ncbi:MAG: hypothetical protein FWF69_02260 [Firmicutes bacterium]|nr:hypothetical protein [Bacillota bacterium]